MSSWRATYSDTLKPANEKVDKKKAKKTPTDKEEALDLLSKIGESFMPKSRKVKQDKLKQSVDEVEKLEDAKAKESGYKKSVARLKKFIEENEDDKVIKMAQQIEVIIKEVKACPKLGKGKTAVFEKQVNAYEEIKTKPIADKKVSASLEKVLDKLKSLYVAVETKMSSNKKTIEVSLTSSDKEDSNKSSDKKQATKSTKTKNKENASEEKNENKKEALTKSVKTKNKEKEEKNENIIDSLVKSA